MTINPIVSPTSGTPTITFSVVDATNVTVQCVVNGGEFDEQEFLQIKGMLAYFSDVRPDLAPCCRADIAEIERLLEMRNRIAA